MIARIPFSLLLLLLTLTSTLSGAPPTFNISHFLYPKITEELRPQPSLFFKDVLEPICESEKWELEGVRVSKLEVGKAKYGTMQGYEIRFGVGKSDLVFRLWDEVSAWKRFKEGGGDFEGLVDEVSSSVVLDSFQIEGPFELRIHGDDELLLMLPLNISHGGLKRVLVGEGITVEVKNAQEATLFHTSDLGLHTNSSLITNRKQMQFWPFGSPMCVPLLPVKILGSASLFAYRTQNPNAKIAYTYFSGETIELLPEKCYTTRTHRKRRYPVEPLRSRITLLEQLFSKFLGDRMNHAVSRAKIKSSALFSFQLELERNVTTSDARWNTMAEWRTRPSVERALFEVIARVDKKRLKPLMVKKMRTFEGVDTSAWSNLMENVSFTKLPSVLVPPEALTLDVKW